MELVKKERCSYEIKNAPKKSDLLKLAETEEDKPIHVCASNYCDVVHELRNKNFSWDEVREWFAAQGLEFSTQSFQSAYKRWLARNDF